jgi:hypothetical protein
MNRNKKRKTRTRVLDFMIAHLSIIRNVFVPSTSHSFERRNPGFALSSGFPLSRE